MKLNEFSKYVCLMENGAKEVNRAQAKEVLKIANLLTKGGVYKLIKEIPEVGNKEASNSASI